MITISPRNDWCTTDISNSCKTNNIYYIESVLKPQLLKAEITTQDHKLSLAKLLHQQNRRTTNSMLIGVFNLRHFFLKKLSTLSIKGKNNVVSDKHDILNMLNDFYRSIGHELAKKSAKTHNFLKSKHNYGSVFIYLELT